MIKKNKIKIILLQFSHFTCFILTITEPEWYNITDMVKSYSNFYDLGIVGLAIFYHLSRLCLQHYIPRSSNTIKMETTLLHKFSIKYF